jgi:hypothetical protein
VRGTGRLAHQHDARWVAAQALGVRAHPTPNRDHVFGAGGPAALGGEAVVGQQRDETFARGPPAEVATLRFVAADESATMQHHQQRACSIDGCLGPVHVEPMPLMRSVDLVGRALHAVTRLLCEQWSVQRLHLRQVEARAQRSQLPGKVVGHTTHVTAAGSL